MELGSKSHNKDGLLGPNSIMVVCMDPLGYILLTTTCSHIPVATKACQHFGPKVHAWNPLKAKVVLVVEFLSPQMCKRSIL